LAVRFSLVLFPYSSLDSEVTGQFGWEEKLTVVSGLTESLPVVFVYLAAFDLVWAVEKAAPDVCSEVETYVH